MPPSPPARPDLWVPGEPAPIRAAWRRWLLGTPPDGLDGWRPRCDVLGDPRAGGPVLLTQTSHRPWVERALRRGWAACLVSACDGDDDTDALPGGDGWSRLARRAWALSRTLDALVADGVDPARVVLAGHSRNGKAALIAAAFDARPGAVVSSSSGVLGAMPARLLCDRHGGEGIELLTRHYPDWFLPGLRDFAGREDELPTDAHELLACIAPRPVLVSVGVRDQVESTWAAERAVDAVRAAYARAGAPPAAVALQWRAGGHRATPAAVAGYLDWAEAALVGRHPAPAPRVHDPAWRAWDPREDDPGAAAPARARVRALCGPRPGSRRRVEVRGPAGAPAVLWLGPLCRAAGGHLGYEQAVPLPDLLVAAGFRVACPEPAGTGSRWARPAPLGRLVADAAAAMGTTGPAWIAGYGAGALTGLLLAAVDDRVLGAALVGPQTGEPVLAPGDDAPGLDALLAAAGPRPVLLATPQGSVAPAAAGPHVEHVALDDHHRLSAATRRAVLRWLAARATPSRLAA